MRRAGTAQLPVHRTFAGHRPLPPARAANTRPRRPTGARSA